MRLGVRGVLLLAVVSMVLLGPASGSGAQEVLRLRVATALSGSGVMDVLRPAFTRDTGLIVQTSVAGSGRSLRDGMNGVVDVLFVNAPPAEAAFMAAGAGLTRWPVMRGHYLLVGPPDDPADVAHAAGAADAFRRIAGKAAMFVSRADDGGGHQREMAIWRMAGIEPYGDWYYEVGLGVQRSLAVAEERHAYMLVDEATWLNHGKGQALAVLYRGDPAFEAVYSVIAVNPALDVAVNSGHARRFISWITSPPAQALIAAYEVKGVHPFQPATGKGG
jgi:tungstate transport system substrate-binding protein